MINIMMNVLRCIISLYIFLSIFFNVGILRQKFCCRCRRRVFIKNLSINNTID